MKDGKIKVLAWGDYCCATGFATVMGNIMRELHKTGKYEIDVLAINYTGDPYDPNKWPGKVWPAMSGIMMQSPEYNDVYGRQRLLDLMGSGDFDVVFMVQDTFVLQPIIKEVKKTQAALAVKEGMKTFKTIYYFPIDAQPKPEWVTEVVANVDFPIAYTNYARDEVLRYAPALKDKLRVIYHGTNFDHFFPIEDEEEVSKFRKEFFQGKADGKFLIANVNRNQSRKDTVRNLMVLKELLRRGRKNVMMYLHMQYMDVGGNVFVMGEQLGVNGDDAAYILPGPNIFNANQGMPIEDINKVYNASDMMFTPTLGEGWGLSITEAMATKTPIVAPGNTSINEILADGRGHIVPAGNSPSLWIVKENDNERIRPLMDVEKAVDAIERIMDGDLPDIEAAYKWVRKLDWPDIVKEWETIIAEAAHAAEVANVAISPFMSRADRRRAEREGKNAGV